MFVVAKLDTKPDEKTQTKMKHTKRDELVFEIRLALNKKENRQI